jgi:hypothetical protein
MYFSIAELKMIPIEILRCFSRSSYLPLVYRAPRIFTKKRIVPFLTRLVGDLTGMEAGRETTIGDKNNVTKCIH